MTDRCARANNHAGTLLSLLGRSCRAIVHWLTSHACTLRDVVWRSCAGHVALRSIIWRLDPCIIHGGGRRSRGAVVRRRRLLILMDTEGGLVLGRGVRGILLLRGLVRVLRPGQLFVLLSSVSPSCEVLEVHDGNCHPAANSAGSAMCNMGGESQLGTYHSLSETFHCHDYPRSHMYSVDEIDARAAGAAHSQEGFELKTRGRQFRGAAEGLLIGVCED